MTKVKFTGLYEQEFEMPAHELVDLGERQGIVALVGDMEVANQLRNCVLEIILYNPNEDPSNGYPAAYMYCPSGEDINLHICKREEFERLFPNIKRDSSNVNIVANKFGEICSCQEYIQLRNILRGKGLSLWDYKLDEAKRL